MAPDLDALTPANRVLRVPLFGKLVAAQVALLTLVMVLAVRFLPGRDTAAELALVGMMIIGLGALLSGWILRVALRPVDDLTETARRVTRGDWSARVPSSPVADERMQQLARVFNEMLEAVALAKATQRDLSRRVLLSEERERERLAHELYAGTAQTMAGVLVRLRILARHVEPSVDASGITEISDELRQALQDIRSIARRLRPPELDEIGVRAALEAHARSVHEKTGVPIHFTGTVPEQRLSADARLGLFRIVQEAICNAVEHADPSRIAVTFEPTATQLHVEVTDDGCGFEVPSGGRLADFSNLGLVGMRERAQYALGTLVIASKPGQGTGVGLTLPLQRAQLGAGASDHSAETRTARHKSGIEPKAVVARIEV